jgi:hypothetical protein
MITREPTAVFILELVAGSAVLELLVDALPFSTNYFR